MKLTSLKENRTVAILLLVLSAVVAGMLFPLTAMLAAKQDGDGLMTALISVEKLTWYFWGQDRFLNLIPAVASFITDTESNLRFQIFLRTFLAYLSPVGVLIFISRSPRFLLLGVAITNAILIAALNHEGLFNLYVQHNPMGTSLVLFTIAWLVSPVAVIHRLPEVAVRAVATLGICAIAYAVNLALLVFTGPLIAYLFLTRESQRKEFFAFGAMNIIAVTLAFTHAKMFGEASTSFAISPSLGALSQGLANVGLHLDPLVAVGVLVLPLLILRTHRMVCKLDLLALVGLGFGMAMLLTNLGWVQQNLFNIRYFLLALLVVAAVCAAVIASVLAHTRLAYPLTLVLLLGSIGLGLNGFSDSYAELVHRKWGVTSKLVGALAIRDDVKVIIGDFWDVWPAVYETSAMRRASHDQTPVAYGAAFRGHVLGGRFLADTVDKGEQSALCFLPEVDACVAQMKKTLALPAHIGIAARSMGEVTAGSKKLIRIRFTVNLSN